MPCTARATISIAGSNATPQTSDDTVNTATPPMNARLCPTASPTRPPSSSRPPKVRTYAVITQLFAASDMARSACMRGSATTTIVPSSVDISCMPVIAMIAIPTTLEASGDRWVRRAADMGSYPTDAVLR